MKNRDVNKGAEQPRTPQTISLALNPPHITISYFSRLSVAITVLILKTPFPPFLATVFTGPRTWQGHPIPLSASNPPRKPSYLIE